MTQLKFKYLAASTLALISVSSLAQEAKLGKLSISHAWARATVPGMQAGGGFLVISNHGVADRLVAAQASVSAATELHTMKIENDMMKMQKVDAIDVPAGETTELKPGGHHIMFINLKAPLKEGDRVELKLRFEKAGAVTLDMPVKPLASSGHSMP